MSETASQDPKTIPFTIPQLRDQLRAISEKKEFWFQKKEALKKDIKDKVQQFRDYKALCDTRNLELKELKAQRDKHNAEVKALIDNIKKLNKQKYKSLKNYNLKIDPTKLPDKINQLEQRVEIETDYEREKKLMGEIKKLKKVYDECAEVFALDEQSRKLDQQIRESRTKADAYHHKILDLTKETDYNLFIEITKHITELKKTQEEAFQIFIEHKNEYLKVTQQFNDQLRTIQAGREQEAHERAKQKQAEHVKLQELAKEKSHVVEDKIKNKKRLTTEDILAFQSQSEA